MLVDYLGFSFLSPSLCIHCWISIPVHISSIWTLIGVHRQASWKKNAFRNFIVTPMDFGHTFFGWKWARKTEFSKRATEPDETNTLEFDAFIKHLILNGRLSPLHYMKHNDGWPSFLKSMWTRWAHATDMLSDWIAFVWLNLSLWVDSLTLQLQLQSISVQNPAKFGARELLFRTEKQSSTNTYFKFTIIFCGNSAKCCGFVARLLFAQSSFLSVSR